MQLTKNTLAIFYKLLHDSLFMALIFFTLSLIAEAVLPGIIVSHIGFSKMVIAILLNIFFLKMLAKKIAPDQIDQTLPAKNNSFNKILFPLIALGALLIFNSLLGMNIFLNLFFLLIGAAVGYLSYRILFE
ncbi:MAG: hypothetical protein NTY33_00585 [Candidatus Moranbacteria bacterium]|nr:hypothetical protein [Candidatus Moranbacteria bacterium]